MSARAVIFDFNGTLFYDTDFHNLAWKTFANNHGKLISPEVIEHNIHGFTNREILNFLFERELSKPEQVVFYEEKEAIYREICYQHPEACQLTAGAEEFLNRLKEKNIPRTIATASYLRNVELYFNMFHLNQWFELDAVIFDTGEYRGKPYPDMFLAAAHKVNIPISECMIIEDSLGGVRAAKNAGAKCIVAITNDNNPGKFSQFDFIDQIITDFRHIDCELV
jgi:beta-phosphoglucomutase